MKITQTTSLTLEQKQSIFELWNLEYPERIGYALFFDFEVYIGGLSETKHLLLENGQNQILGWAFTFVREEEDWFGIIVNSKIQGRGFGILLLNELKTLKSILNGWVIDHQNDLKKNKKPYLSPLGFYTKNGFLVLQNHRIENVTISAVKIKWERE